MNLDKSVIRFTVSEVPNPMGIKDRLEISSSVSMVARRVEICAHANPGILRLGKIEFQTRSLAGTDDIHLSLGDVLLIGLRSSVCGVIFLSEN